MKKFLNFLFIGTALQASAATYVGNSTANLEIDFLRDTSCTIDNMNIDFGSVEVGVVKMVTTHLSGNCVDGLHIKISPQDTGELLENSLKGVRYKILFNNNKYLKDNLTDSLCTSGVFANINENGCHIELETQQGSFSIPMDVRIESDARHVSKKFQFGRIVPLEVRVTYE